MIRRVTRILDTPGVASKPRWFWLAIPVALVALAAPRVTAQQLPTATSTQTTFAAALGAASVEKALEQRELHRQWTADELAAARKRLRVYRVDRSGASLDDRWRDALADAARQRFGDF